MTDSYTDKINSPDYQNPFLADRERFLAQPTRNVLQLPCSCSISAGRPPKHWREPNRVFGTFVAPSDIRGEQPNISLNDRAVFTARQMAYWAAGMLEWMLETDQPVTEYAAQAVFLQTYSRFELGTRAKGWVDHLTREIPAGEMATTILHELSQCWPLFERYSTVDRLRLIGGVHLALRGMGYTIKLDPPTQEATVTIKDCKAYGNSCSEYGFFTPTPEQAKRAAERFQQFQKNTAVRVINACKITARKWQQKLSEQMQRRLDEQKWAPVEFCTPQQIENCEAHTSKPNTAVVLDVRDGTGKHKGHRIVTSDVDGCVYEKSFPGDCSLKIGDELLPSEARVGSLCMWSTRTRWERDLKWVHAEDQRDWIMLTSYEYVDGNMWACIGMDSNGMVESFFTPVDPRKVRRVHRLDTYKQIPGETAAVSSNTSDSLWVNMETGQNKVEKGH